MSTDMNTIFKEVNKKQDVLTDKAVKAKENYEQLKSYLKTHPAAQSPSEEDDLQELTVQVQALKQTLKASHFDDLIFFLANPGQILSVNFFIGLVRGIGFAIGFLTVGLICLYTLLSVISPHLVSRILHLIFS
jgi:predicted translin family RNA/ssDNA-binding protein